MKSNKLIFWAAATLFLWGFCFCANAENVEKKVSEKTTIIDQIVGESNQAMPDEPKNPTRELFYKMMQMVAIALVLGVAAIYISKKFLPKITNLTGKKIKVLETVNLGSRKALHLIKVADKQILIASTNENINYLTEIKGDIENENSPDQEEVK